MKAKIYYEAKSLAEIAEHFEEKAKDCEKSSRGNKLQQAERETEAGTWRHAARILRKTTMVVSPST